MPPQGSQDVCMEDLQVRDRPRRQSVSSQDTLESYNDPSEPQHPDIASQDGDEEESLPLAVRVDAHRDLGWVDVAALIINKMVGSGIFTGPYLALTYTQNKNVFIVLWVLGFVYTVASMLLYLEYVRDLPYTGGELVYLDHIIPKPRLLAYTVYAFYFVFIYTSCTNALQFARQVLIAVDLKNLDYDNINGDALRFIAICIISLICLMLYFSTAKSQLMNKVTAVLKLALLCVVVIAGGIYIGKHGAASDFSGPPKPLAGGSNWTLSFLTILFAYHGWENATLVAGEIPRYNELRRGFMVSVFAVGTLYLLIISIFSFAFSWGQLQDVGPEYLAAILGGSDRAQTAAAVIIAFSTAGSLISVSYTCVRVKQTIAWAGILPWSSIWRRSAPLRLKYSVVYRPDSSYPQQDERPTLRKGTPEGGIILHWIVTFLYICITAAIHPLDTAISVTGQLLVYGHFFVSVTVGLAFFRFKPGTAGRVPAPLWNAPKAPMWIYSGYKSWIVKAFLGLVPFSFGAVIIVAEPISPANRYAFYVMIALIVVALLHWIAFVHVDTASKLYARAGFSMEHCIHGIDDATNIERQCNMCIEFNPPERHRHAQEGYQNYNRLTVNEGNSSARFLYHVFGGSNTTMYPDLRIDSMDIRRFLPRKWLRRQPAPS